MSGVPEGDADMSTTTVLPVSQVQDAEDAVLYIPTNYDEKVKVIWRKVRWVIKMAIATTKKGVTLPSDLETQLCLFLRAMNNVEMTDRLGKATHVQTVFRAIVAEPTNFNLPRKYADMIIALWNKWEEDNWGKGEEEGMEEEDEGEEVEEEELAWSPTPNNRDKDKDNTIAIRRAPPTHPIFGISGIMRGIITMQRKTRTYLLDDTFQRSNPKVFGHNSLRVGDWWPMQIAALRDGAHGSRMGGIAGSTKHGAYSIVVSGHYSKLDRDLGDILYYSGSGSSENKSEDPADTHGTRCLIRSIETRKPVRVLRSAGGGGAAPPVGIRYDGLYRVESSEILQNDLGGAYLQFRLVRQAKQDGITYLHPTPRERQDCEYIKLGY